MSGSPNYWKYYICRTSYIATVGTTFSVLAMLRFETNLLLSLHATCYAIVANQSINCFTKVEQTQNYNLNNKNDYKMHNVLLYNYTNI